MVGSYSPMRSLRDSAWLALRQADEATPTVPPPHLPRVRRGLGGSSTVPMLRPASRPSDSAAVCSISFWRCGARTGGPLIGEVVSDPTQDVCGPLPQESARMQRSHRVRVRRLPSIDSGASAWFVTERRCLRSVSQAWPGSSRMVAADSLVASQRQVG